MRLADACIVPLLTVALLVGGCAGRGGNGIDEPLKLDRVSFDMKRGANDNRPTRVDLVRVREVALLNDLVEMDTAAWYGAAGEAFRAANPDAITDTWELVPGRPSGPFKVRLEGDYAGVLFCDAGGPSPASRLQRDGHVTIEADDRGCTVVGGKRQESLLNRLRRSKFAKLSFALPIAVNQNRPVRVALVRVKDANLVVDLTRYDSDRWFGAGGEAFRQDHPDALYDDWELVPGENYGPFRLAVNKKVAGVLFCSTPGAPPLQLDWKGDVEVEIDNEGCQLAVGQGRGVRWNPLTWGGWR